jgi:transposase
MWVYRSSQFTEHPVVIYDYQAGMNIPKPFQRRILATYSAMVTVLMEALENIALSGCWAHARRKFNDALIAPPKKTGKANVAISTIQKFYAIEKRTKLLPSNECQRIRKIESVPILYKFKIWLDESSQTLTLKSYLGTAVSYTLNYWQALTHYVENGELALIIMLLSTISGPLRRVEKGRMFAPSIKGPQASAVLYSIVMTCRVNEINPYFYFQKLFEELPNRVDSADLSDLLAWDAQFKP